MNTLGRSPKRGTVMVLTVLLMLILIGLIGLALDVALMGLIDNRLQTGADAAALAGARLVRSDQLQARQAARDIAVANPSSHGGMIHLQLNEANAAGGDIVIGRYNRTTKTFTPQVTSVNAIQVRARRTAGSLDGPLPLCFGPIFGVSTSQLERLAIAMISGGTGSGIICLDEGNTPKAFYVRGSAIVHVDGGDIQVNSSNAEAAYLQGAKLIVDAPSLDVVGGINPSNYTPPEPYELQLNPGSDVIHDPLASLAAPPWDPAQDLSGSIGKSGSDMTLLPGYYKSGFSFSGGIITLRPGIYVLGGAGLDIRGTTQMLCRSASGAPGGVMFYIVQGPVNINGTGSITLHAPDPTQDSFAGVETYEGVLFFQARDNTTANLINGTGGLDLEGTIYLPGGHTTLSGTSDKMGTQLLVKTLEIAGDANVTINYDGRNNTVGFRCYLVR